MIAWLAVGFAQDVPVTPPEDLLGPARPLVIDAPIVRKHVTPSYPPVRLSTPVECHALVAVDLEGHPSNVTVNDCDLPFATPTRDAISQWTFEAMDQPFTARVRVPFAAISGSFAELPAKQLTPLLQATRPSATPRAADAPCALTVQIDPAGAVTDQTSNALPTCLVRIDAPALAPKKAWKAVSSPVTCSLHVLVGATPNVTVDACPKAVVASATALAQSWSYNVQGDSTSYDLDLTFAR